MLLLICCAFGPHVHGQSHWDVKSSNSNASLNAVTFGNGLFVAVGDKGAIVTSPDGEVWTPRISGTTDRLTAIAFGKGRFVATRENRSAPAMTSLDGSDWTPVTVTDANGAAAESGASRCITFGQGEFMAIGALDNYPTEIMRSVDGVSFKVVIPAKYPAPNALTVRLRSLAYIQGRFYGNEDIGDGAVYSTVDGIEWKPTAWPGGTFIVSDGGAKVALLPPRSPLGGGFSTDAGHTFRRARGAVDLYTPSNRTYAELTTAVHGAGGYVALDKQAGVWTSERGEYWLLRGRYGSGDQQLRGLAFDGSERFVTVGSAASSGGFALAAVAKADPVLSPPGYTVYSLKDLTGGVFDGEARAISNNGVIGGSVVGPTGGPLGAIFHNGSVRTFVDPAHPAYHTSVTSVNDSGVGAMEVVSYPYSGMAVPSQVRTFPGGYLSNAPSITSNGVIVGGYFNYARTLSGIYRYDTNTGITTDMGGLGLTNMTVTSANERGDVVGTYVYGRDAQTHVDRVGPFKLSSDGQLIPIPTLGGWWVNTVITNSNGDIAGSASLPSAPSVVNAGHAFLYKGGVTADIDMLNSRESIALGMNNQAEVVGYFDAVNPEPWHSIAAFLYRDGVMYDLNRLLDASGDGWTLERARAINDKGWIVGEGWRHGQQFEPFLAVPSPAGPAATQNRFVNVSTRLKTGLGDDALIAGFVLRGGPKRLILRALGPTLPVPGTPSNPNLADPTLELFNDRGERLAFNDNFDDLPYSDRNRIGGLGMSLGPNGLFLSTDSVVAVILPEGSYTAVVRGKGGTAGTALVEVYNADTDYTAGLVNISTRGPVGTADNVMIAGFIVRGDRQKQILVRAIGPSLSAAGVENPLADPMLEIHDANGQIAQNDDWRSNQEAELNLSALAPGADSEAAIILSLWPGAYTAILRGKAASTGNALVEVYNLPEP